MTQTNRLLATCWAYKFVIFKELDLYQIELTHFTCYNGVFQKFSWVYNGWLWNKCHLIALLASSGWGYQSCPYVLDSDPIGTCSITFYYFSLIAARAGKLDLKADWCHLNWTTQTKNFKTSFSDFLCFKASSKNLHRATVKCAKSGNTKEGSITVPSTSCLTGLD